MKVKDVREVLKDYMFAHCTDAILSIVLDKPRTEINDIMEVSEEDVNNCILLAKDFKNSYSLIYKRGRMYFMDILLVINEDVFPPVFATERFVNTIIDLCHDRKKVLEIGTGSGAMAIALAKSVDVDITATDISSEALEVARENILKNDVDIKLVLSDLFLNINDKYDLIFSNPPQQRSDALNELEDNGKLITPRVASDGGGDGFNLYNSIKNNAKKYLNKDGILVLQYDGQTNIYTYNEL